jgi:glycosyltransferase involved in cell wall biosynthesis
MFASDQHPIDTRPLVSVITGATGHRGLARCMASVQNQTYERVEHWVVVDGAHRMDSVQAALAGTPPANFTRHVVVLPRATGKDRFNGHRIYAAFGFIADGQYVAFLDEDNWFDDGHVESLVTAVATSAAPWAFSLRKIVDQNGDFIAFDRCESLGNLHPAFYGDDEYLVDTNCYLIRRDLAARFSPIWNRPARPPPGTSSADRALCRALMAEHPNAPCTRLHSVNYAVGNRPDSVGASFFLHGNEVMQKRHPRGLPWEAEP